MISTVERNRAAARWKEMMEKDFDIDYVPGIDQSSPEMRTAAANMLRQFLVGGVVSLINITIHALVMTAFSDSRHGSDRVGLNDYTHV